MMNITYCIIVVAISIQIQQAVGFNGIHNHHAQYSQLFSTTEESAEISTTEEATVSNSQTYADNFLISPMDDISKDMQMDDSNVSDTADITALSVKAISAAAFIGLLSSSSIPSTFITTYSTMLLDYPLPTKSITSGILCGISDIIAQFRDQKRRKFNYARLVRFAGEYLLSFLFLFSDGDVMLLELKNECILFRWTAYISTQ